jgi:hypothetical protein
VNIGRLDTKIPVEQVADIGRPHDVILVDGRRAQYEPLGSATGSEALVDIRTAIGAEHTSSIGADVKSCFIC